MASRLVELVMEAEHRLLLCHYAAAEVASSEALQLGVQLASQPDKVPLVDALHDRAAVVLLQALFETGRFSNGRSALCASFGSLEATPANPLLLWLSLALDTPTRGEAQILILQLLEGKAPAAAGWSRRQYLTLLHLYVVEVLLPALKDPSEVRRWLQRQPFLPLNPQERQFLEEEVEAAAGQAADTSTTPHEAARRRSTACLSALGAAPHLAATWEQGGEGGHPHGAADDEDCAMDSAFQREDAAPVERAAKGPDTPAAAGVWLPQESSTPADGSSCGPSTRRPRPTAPPPPLASVHELDWLGRWHRCAFQAAGTVYEAAAAALAAPFAATPSDPPGAPPTSAAASSGSSKGGEALTAWPQAQAAAGVAVALAVGYAAWTERRTIRSKAGAARREVVRGLTDLLRMALSVTPNPVAAPRG